MPWDANLTNLRDVLVYLYPSQEDSIRVVQDAGLPLANIAFNRKPSNNWSEILSEADKLGKVADIINVTLREYPGNQFLLSAQEGTLTPVRLIVDNTLVWKSSQPEEDVLEKIIGKQSTLLPISWLEVGLQRSRSIAKIQRADHTFGTGFLLKHSLLLTNHHVLPTRDIAEHALALFNNQQSIDGLDHEITPVELNPESFFKTSAENDWTLVRVQSDANAKWGAIDVNPVEIKVDNYANIIQHPAGGPKQIALYHNIITYVDKTRIQYLTDTLPGSSGSAVFDSQWRLIAVHHAGGSIREPGTKKQVYRNEGIRIDCILKDLEADDLF